MIGGDAANDVQEPPRKTSTSDEVEKLAKGADIIVQFGHSSCVGAGQGQRSAASGLLPPEQRDRSWRHGASAQGPST